MDDKRIHDLLNDYAKKEIPDDMNLWNDLKSELMLPGRATRNRSLSLVLAILIMLGAALAVYAVVNQQITGDLGVEGAREANLVTDLNLSQTIDGVTLTLAWAYADASRLAFGYSITAPEGQGGTSYQANVAISDAANSFYSSGGGGGGGGGSNMSRESQYTMSYGIAFVENPPEVLDMRVEFMLEESRPMSRDEVPANLTAVLLSDAVGLGDIATEAVFLSNTSAEAVDMTGWTIADQSEHLYTFPSFTLDPNATIVVYTGAGEDSATALYWGEEEAIWVPGEVLTLANDDGVTLGFFPVGGRDTAGGGGGGGSNGGGGSADAGGGGFGGGFGFGGYPEGTPQPGIQAYGGLSMRNSIGPFVFEFEMPYLPALQLTPEQTVEANGVSITLDSLTVSPSTTIAHFCFNLPTPGDWMPIVSLRAGAVDVGTASWAMDVTSTPEDTIRCGTTGFYAPYQLEPTTFTFTVSELQTSASFTPERADRFKAILAEQGIEVEILEASGEGFNYNLVNQPDGDVGMAIYHAMTEAFNDHHVGPWLFTVEIPGMER